MTLALQYQNAVKAYIEAFAAKHEIYIEFYSLDFFEVYNTFVPLSDIMTDIDLNVPSNLFIKFIDYRENGGSFNYKNWIKHYANESNGLYL